MLEHCLLSVNYSQKYFSHSFMLHNWTAISINPLSTKKFFFKSWSHFSVCSADRLDHLVLTGVCVTNFFFIELLCRHNFIPPPPTRCTESKIYKHTVRTDRLCTVRQLFCQARRQAGGLTGRWECRQAGW
jgi:hypothetical protein